MKRSRGWKDWRPWRQWPRNQRARSFSKPCQRRRNGEGWRRPMKICMPLMVTHVTRFHKRNLVAKILFWSKIPCWMMFGSKIRRGSLL